MSEQPRYGQRAPEPSRQACSKHPQAPAVAYCKRCNRPACADCAIPTDVGAICTDCASGTSGGRGQGRARFSAAGSSPWGQQARAQKAAGGGASARTGSMLTSAAKSPVTAVLVTLNVAMFLVDAIWPSAYAHLVFWPAGGFYQPWRLLTTSFLHAGFFHLLFNMLMLVLLGGSIERAYGHWRYLAIYLFSAIGGSIAIIAWVFAQPATWTTATVGASGAVFGLFGAIFIAQRKAGMSTTSIVVLLVVNLVYGFVVPNISWQAHVGGFIVGMATAAVYLWVADASRKRRLSARAGGTWAVVATVVIAAILAGLTYGLYGLLLA